MKIWLSAIGVLILWSAVSAAVFAQDNNPLTLQGEVKDQFGGLIPGAAVNLSRAEASKQTVVTDKQGVFRFDSLPNGIYFLSVSAKDFALHEEQLELSEATAKLKQLSITLYPTVHADVAVNEDIDETLNAERDAGIQILTEKVLESLPDDPDQFTRQLKNLAEATTGGVPGAEGVTIDGFSNGRVPPKSSIQQVRITPHTYSAEYPSPGTRIEIITKPGANSLNGAVFFNYNGTALNARDPLAVKRADTNTRLYGFEFGAPIKKNRAGFFFSFEKRDINEQSIVNAVVLDDNFQPTAFIFNSPNPKRLILGSARADWQINQNNTLALRYNFSRNKFFGNGVGGKILPESGNDGRETENGFRLSENAVLNPRTVNELRIGLTFNKTEQTALSNQPSIIVAGSFTSGGSGLQQLSLNDNRLEISDYVTTAIGGTHNLKFGVQIFNKLIGDLTAENTNGSFFFGGTTIDGSTVSSLEQYRRALSGAPGATPTRFSLTTGVPSISGNQWLFAAFFQEQWKPNSKILFNLGLRYEGQTAPTDAASLAPRLGIAYTPDKNKKWLFRASAGIFYERFDYALVPEAERLDGRNQRQIIVDAPSFPNPFSGGTINNAVTTIRVLDPDLQPPRFLQMGVGFERALPQGWKVSAGLGGTIGWHRVRSRNINAPLVSASNSNPFTAPRPLGTLENILQFESSGRQKSRSFSVSINQNSNKYFTFNLSYTNLDFRTDADYSFALPQSSYDFTGELTRPNWLARHRIFVAATAKLPYKINLSAWFNATSGTPFNVTTGRDNNGDGNFNDRPDLSFPTDSQAVATIFGFLNPNVVNGKLPRNLGTNPAPATLDLNLNRAFILGPKPKNGENRYKLTVNIRAGNLLNRSNLFGTDGVLSSPLFGRATTANPARRIDLGLRFSF